MIGRGASYLNHIARTADLPLPLGSLFSLIYHRHYVYSPVITTPAIGFRLSLSEDSGEPTEIEYD